MHSCRGDSSCQEQLPKSGFVVAGLLKRSCAYEKRTIEMRRIISEEESRHEPRTKYSDRCVTKPIRGLKVLPLSLYGFALPPCPVDQAGFVAFVSAHACHAAHESRRVDQDRAGLTGPLVSWYDAQHVYSCHPDSQRRAVEQVAKSFCSLMFSNLRTMRQAGKSTDCKRRTYFGWWAR